MSKICNDLIEAYKGFYEDEWSVKDEYNQFVKSEGKDGLFAVQDFGSWLDMWVLNKIQADKPSQRLDVYLTWNGILGYTNRIWEISQGEIHV